MRIDFAGAEGVGGRDLRKADEGVHERQLARIVELEARNAFAGRGDGGFGQPLELTAIDKRLEDILLDIQVIVIDRGELVAQGRKMLDSLVHSVVGHVVAGGLGPEDQVVAHILLDKAVAVMAADHRVGQVHVFDLGLQLAAVLFGDLAAEDDGDLVRLADGPVGVEQAFAQFVERGAATKDQIVAEFDLGEEQPVPAARLSPLCFGKERSEAGQPFLAAAR